MYGKPIRQSSNSAKKSDAVKLRDKLLGKRYAGDLRGGRLDKVLIGELLDDVLKSDIKESTRYIWTKVVEKNIRPFFGKFKATRLSTDAMDDYRAQRLEAGVIDSTVNRELSILRTAFHNGRKRTPPKVATPPYFPIVKETKVRQGFLSDEVYALLRDELPQELKALFVTYYTSGVRKSELLDIQWPQVEFESGFILLEKGATKTDDPRTLPILKGDMRDLLLANWTEHQAKWPDSPWVFNRRGDQIKDFRVAWNDACTRAGVPGLLIHDLRRTAVRNMRRAGVPQVMRKKISGHKTDSMERRYDIAGAEGLGNAKQLMEIRMNTGKEAGDIAKDLLELGALRMEVAALRRTA